MTAAPGCACTTYEILKAGSGKAITAGSNPTVHATGVVKETGKKFWSTKDPGQSPFSYEAGRGKVIKGWDQGCLGMQVGEERKITIGGSEGYGAGGFPAWGIPPNATLEFTLECLSDIIAYVDKEGVPVNSGHNWAFRCDAPIEATSRHLPDLPWTKVDLGKPFWQASEAEIKGSPPAAVTYVYKSFGDMHTTVPVEPHESERAGRFVRQAKTECGIHTRTTSAGAPHGGSLVDLMVKDPADAKKLVASAAKTIELNERQACDVFCLLSGAFSPLTGFMDETTYDSVVKAMRLPEKQLFGLPVIFDMPQVDGLKTGDKLLLKWKGEDVAVLEASSIWEPNKVVEAKECYGTSSLEHPTVAGLVQEIGKFYVGGRIHGLQLPKFGYTTQTPAEVRATLPENKQVVAFQNRNPIHRAHFELLICAQKDVKDSVLLVHPTCGPTQPGDIDGLVRIQTYEALKKETEKEYPMFRWAYLPYSMKMAGPREAIQHMIIRKNYGATHFIIGRDMAGTKSTIDGEDFYGAYDAQETGKKYSAELGVTVTHYENMVP
ncbi:unnamed protein product [Effrenium voratum]|nr:unnamed protein product [Effrenium voratum]